jgi:hypothetical protein
MTASLGNGFGTRYSLAKVNTPTSRYSLGMSLILPLYTGLNLRVSLPTLEEYVALTPRLVTPVRAPLLRIGHGDALDSRYPSRSIHRMPI